MEPRSVYHGLPDHLPRTHGALAQLERIAVKPSPGTDPVQLMIPVRTLRFDPFYQRFPSMAAVAKIVKGFEPRLLGTITVSLRADGEWYVIDGQHRVLALREIGDTDREVPALCYAGLTVAEEAWLFVESQRRRRPLTPTDVFRADLAAGQEEAHDILQIVEDCGFRLHVTSSTNDQKNGHIGSIAALRRVYRSYRQGPAILQRTLGVLAAAYGTEEGPPGVMIDGLALFLNRYDFEGATVDMRRLAQVLRQRPVEQLIADGRGLAGGLGGHLATGIARSVFSRYQSGLRSARLPGWDEAESLARSAHVIAGKANLKARLQANGEGA